ncbi:cytochrome b5-like heme/steroid binding domain-containing protein, partial [Thamnocephalis sphaerospora]
PINWVLVGLLAYMTRAYLHRATPQVPLPRTQRPRVFETFTPQTLVRHDGHHDVALPIYLAVKGKVYDVTPGRSFYGPEGPYGNFAGHDASRGLAKGSFEADMIMPLDQPIDTLADLTDEERQALDDWEGHFANKYDCVGELV